MNREEAIAEIVKYIESDCYLDAPSNDAMKIALSALDGPTREQVEKAWRGEWKIVEYEFFTCSHCGDGYYNGAESRAQAESYLNSGYVNAFCPHCGAPMTDKAVDMVLERIHSMLEV